MELLLGLIVLVLDIIAIVSVVGSASSVERKLLWVLVILLLPILGMVLYFVFGQKAGKVGAA